MSAGTEQVGGVPWRDDDCAFVEVSATIFLGE